MKKSVELEYLKEYKRDLKILKSKLEKLRTDDNLRRKFVKSFSELVSKSVGGTIAEDFYYIYSGSVDRAFENITKFLNVLIEKSKKMDKKDKNIFFDIAFEFYNIKIMNDLLITEDEIFDTLSKHQINCDENIEDFVLSRTGDSLKNLVSIFVGCFYYNRLKKFDPVPTITNISAFEMNFNFKEEEFIWSYVYDEDEYWDTIFDDDYDYDTKERPLQPGSHKLFSIGSEVEGGKDTSLLFYKFLVFSYLLELEGRIELEEQLFETGFELLDSGFIDDFIIKNTNKIIADNLIATESELKDRTKIGCFPDYLKLFQNKDPELK